MSIRLTTVFFFLTLVTLQAQPLRSTLLQRLYEAKDPISSISTPSLTGLFPHKVDQRYPFNKQYFVKTDRELYLGIAGTGLLYKVIPIASGLYDIEKVDSTLYSGNNFCAANFSIDSVVYSFGGYGFWKTNGTLKQYNIFSKEWDVIPLLEERSSTFCNEPSGIFWKSSPVNMPDIKNYASIYAPSFFWVDTKSKLIFTGAQHVVNEGMIDSLRVNNSEFNTRVSVLNIENKSWVTLGNLLKYGWHYNIHLPWGSMMIESPESVYIADFKSNKLFYCKEELLPNFRFFFKSSTLDLLFYSNGFLYLGNLALNTFDSIPINRSDFIYTGESLYEKSNTSKNFQINSLIKSPVFLLVFTITLLLIVLLLIVLYRRKNLSNSAKSNLLAAAAIPPNERIGLLNEIEIELIQLLVAHSVKGRKTSIEEVNKLAGVGQKNEPIRRRVRSELINSINEKWIIITGSRDRLITSIKSNFDGRTREYYILEKWLSSPLLINLSKQSSHHPQ